VVVRALVRGDQDRHVVRAPLHLQMLHGVDSEDGCLLKDH
jgi:hypothetical protein